jgi:hypothetical protein
MFGKSAFDDIECTGDLSLSNEEEIESSKETEPVASHHRELEYRVTLEHRPRRTRRSPLNPLTALYTRRRDEVDAFT